MFKSGRFLSERNRHFRHFQRVIEIALCGQGHQWRHLQSNSEHPVKWNSLSPPGSFLCEISLTHMRSRRKRERDLYHLHKYLLARIFSKNIQKLPCIFFRSTHVWWYNSFCSWATQYKMWIPFLGHAAIHWKSQISIVKSTVPGCQGTPLKFLAPPSPVLWAHNNSYLQQ